MEAEGHGGGERSRKLPSSSYPLKNSVCVTAVFWRTLRGISKAASLQSQAWNCKLELLTSSADWHWRENLWEKKKETTQNKKQAFSHTLIINLKGGSTHGFLSLP